MNRAAKLTKRETEIAELFAWGASKKDIANRLFISERTVENHARNIYEKTGCEKVNELSAWWFCTTFHISFDLSPFKRKFIAWCMLAVLLPTIAKNDNVMVRFRMQSRTTRIQSRKSEDGTADFQII